MRWITGLLTALFLTFAAAAPAQAHAALIASNPAAGALLEAAPTTFVLEFSEDVALVSGNALLLPDGTTLELEGTGGGRRLRVNAPASDQLGTHVLTWRVLSQDGHVISGSLPFAVGEESALVPPRAVDDGGIELRSLLAVLVLVGAVLVVGLAWSRGLAPPSRRRTALLCGAAVTAAGSALGRLLVLRADVGAWVGIEVAAVVLLAAGLVLCVTGAPWGRSWGGFAVLLGLAAVGHSRVTAHPWLSGAADVVHAAAAAVWVGGLVVLALDGRGLEPVDRLSSYRRFARRALAALVVVAVSGTVLSVQILGSWHALVASAHGRLLLLKVGLVIVAVLLGLAHRLALARRAAGDGPTVLSRITRVEAALLVAVLVATGLLGELSSSRLGRGRAWWSDTSRSVTWWCGSGWRRRRSAPTRSRSRCVTVPERGSRSRHRRGSSCGRVSAGWAARCVPSRRVSCSPRCCPARDGGSWTCRCG
ncbi:copper resistance CopC/CopD family protein [Nocardioides alcanivorans]|uniref:copper resistance CopC/CopD family protein n=1 Tax=Nocardioides alcanivorans TaxID=2897352 RepID=UPI001F1B112B|nr:copper resistance protein CopC [Nocardioides alcanivorans]